MPEINRLKILFVINPVSGNNTTDWPSLIAAFFKDLNHTIELFELKDDCKPETIKEKINQFNPQQVIAVGGDGTIKLVAECLLQKNIPLGILPAGSANGLAKELGISEKPEQALNTLVKGVLKKIHVTRINDHLCIHLSDIGFNALVIKKFEMQRGRGMWGYLKASVKVLFNKPRMEMEILINEKAMKINAAMVVIANGTKYGSGAVINPLGKLDDEVFEVIALKKISLPEIFKMKVSHASFHPDKTSVYQTNSLTMRSARKVHFQVDGEYLGKVNEIKGLIIPGALEIIVPEEEV